MAKRKSTDRSRLTDGESCVMKIIWRADRELCLMEIVERVNRLYGKAWSKQTVSTFLRKIIDKEFMYMRRRGRQFYYYILIGEKEYTERMIEECLDFWANGDIPNMLSVLYEKRKLNEKDIENIKHVLNDIASNDAAEK